MSVAASAISDALTDCSFFTASSSCSTPSGPTDVEVLVSGGVVTGGFSIASDPSGNAADDSSTAVDDRIIVAADVSWYGDTDLTLTAPGGIHINAGVSVNDERDYYDKEGRLFVNSALGGLSGSGNITVSALGLIKAVTLNSVEIFSLVVPTVPALISRSLSKRGQGLSLCLVPIPSIHRSLLGKIIHSLGKSS